MPRGKGETFAFKLGCHLLAPVEGPAWSVSGYFSLWAYENRDRWDRAFSLSSLAAGGGPRPIQGTPASSAVSNWTPLAFAGCGGASFMTFQATAPERRGEEGAGFPLGWLELLLVWGLDSQVQRKGGACPSPSEGSLRKPQVEPWDQVGKLSSGSAV